jgi:hypothetical protein
MPKNEYPLWAILQRERRPVAWLARECGYSANMLYRCKMGDRRPSDRLRAKIASVLDLPEYVLFRGREQAA